MPALKADGAIIILAYPEEFVAMIPTWYRKPLEWINVVQDGMICAGHSACILINKSTGILEYSDFGRYIAPFGKGRVRTQGTDPDVVMEVKARFDQLGNVTNIRELCNYIYKHPEKTHGAGRLYVSVNQNINYSKAKNFIEEMNTEGSVPYGPFIKNGTNCSRYVMDVLLHGMMNASKRRRLKLASSFTASPLGNVFFGMEGNEVYQVNDFDTVVYSGSKLRQIISHFFLKKENRPKIVHEKNHPGEGFQWLGGVGSGSWFKLDQISNAQFKITRLQGSGEMVFSKVFELTYDGFNFEAPFNFIYDSNAMWCTINQNEGKYIFRS